MAKSKKKVPSLKELECELNRVDHNSKFNKLLRSTVYVLLVVAACAVLVTVLIMPVLRIYGSSMNPTLSEGQIVVSVKSKNYKTGDLAAFYLGNKLLVKRYFAGPGDWVNIDETGNIYINGEKIEEDYIIHKSKGITDIKYPYQVPENTIFLIGDNRETSIDSRSSSVGCIPEDQVVGKILLRVWPLKEFGKIK